MDQQSECKTENINVIEENLAGFICNLGAGKTFATMTYYLKVTREIFRS
jgi:hypothetical protein